MLKLCDIFDNSGQAAKIYSEHADGNKSISDFDSLTCRKVYDIQHLTSNTQAMTCHFHWVGHFTDYHWHEFDVIFFSKLCAPRATCKLKTTGNPR